LGLGPVSKVTAATATVSHLQGDVAPPIIVAGKEAGGVDQRAYAGRPKLEEVSDRWQAAESPAVPSISGQDDA
jgi:hypothetical protein